eukprot:s6523_g4.t1
MRRYLHQKLDDRIWSCSPLCVTSQCSVPMWGDSSRTLATSALAHAAVPSSCGSRSSGARRRRQYLGAAMPFNSAAPQATQKWTSSSPKASKVDRSHHRS